MRDQVAMLATTAALERSVRVLTERLQQLETQARAGAEGAWGQYTETVRTLALLLPALATQQQGQLLTTAEMAARLGVTPKTLLKRKARGDLTPAFQAGKLIRWRRTETV